MKLVKKINFLIKKNLKIQLFLTFVFVFIIKKILKNKNKLLFFCFSLTKKGKKVIKENQKKAIDIIKDTVFKTKWSYNFNLLQEKTLDMTFLKYVVENRKNKLNHKISGTMYNMDETNKQIASYMYKNYMYSNPLHTDLYPELNKMESEIVKIVGNLFDMPDSGGGNLTTGGTESTILAIKAYKKIKQKNSLFNRKLEVITTKTGHAAINKACELLDLKLVYVNLNKDKVMDISDLKRKISSNTCVVIASAPCYPYGLIDPIKDISNVCKKKKVYFHVDSCLGGFITQFDSNLKISFNDDIDSLSVDPHKFGYAPKGSSLLLWKDRVSLFAYLN